MVSDDSYSRRGRRSRAIPGHEFSGVVEAVESMWIQIKSVVRSSE
jgi:threonine dehydrogenase-like Zn-dependent dehydrogenase